jgi:hypothetical protein
MAGSRSALVHGLAAGLLAGSPQVLVTQAEARLLGLPRQRGDIGPRFVQRLAQRVGESPSPLFRWTLVAAFHFGYAAQWGILYGLLQERQPMRPLVGGPQLAALIYLLTFSPWGAATRSGTERPPERRPERESLLHWTAALTFSLVTAYAYRWLHQRAAVLPRPLGGAPA